MDKIELLEHIEIQLKQVNCQHNFIGKLILTCSKCGFRQHTTKRYVRNREHEHKWFNLNCSKTICGLCGVIKKK